MTSNTVTTNRPWIASLQRVAIAAALMLTAAIPGIRGHQATVTVQSNLAAAEGNAAGAEIGMPIITAANYVSSAIAVRHWGKTEITVHVTPSDNDDKTPAEVTEQASKALALWNSRFKTVNLKLTDSDDADVDVSFVIPGKLANGAVGKTDTQFDPENNEISHAGIKINEDLPKAELEQAIGHEMGHALGIQGHSTNKSDLMYPSAHLPIAITDRDVNTLTAGYVALHH